MLLIQITAALLLLFGSALIFRALAAIDGPAHPRPVVRPRRDRAPELAHDTPARVRLPRAA